MANDYVSCYFFQPLEHICPVDMPSRQLCVSASSGWANYQCLKSPGRLISAGVPLRARRSAQGGRAGARCLWAPWTDPLLQRFLHRHLYAIGYLKWSSLWSVLEPQTRWAHFIVKSCVINWIYFSTREIWLIYNKISPTEVWASSYLFTSGVWRKIWKIVEVWLALVIYFAHCL